MAVKAKLHRLEGGEGEIEVPEALVEGPVHKDLLYRAVVSYLTNQRQGTHATKTRAMVAGSGRKIWPQKYTGRARHGDGIPKDATALIVLAQEENTIPVKKSFSNLPGVECVPALSVHPYEILKHEWLLLTAGALQELLTRRLQGQVN